MLMAVLGGGTFAHTNGPPSLACGNLRPGSSHGLVAGNGNGGFVLVVPALLAENISVSNGGFGYEPSTSYRG